MGGLAHMGRRDDGQPIVLAPAGAAAEMGDLDHHRRALFMHVVGQFLQPRHAFVLVEKDVAERLRTVRRDDRRAADHGERDAALGLFGVIEPVALFRHAVLGVGRLMGGRHQPVAQGQAAQLEGLQQWICWTCDGSRRFGRTIGSAAGAVNPSDARRPRANRVDGRRVRASKEYSFARGRFAGLHPGV